MLTSALDENRDEAIRAGAAVVLDSDIPPLDKLGVAQDVLAEVDRANEAGELPDVERAFADRPDDDEWRTLAAGLQDQLDRAVTSAFSGPFLLAAALTLCALVPCSSCGGGHVRRFAPLLVVLGLSRPWSCPTSRSAEGASSPRRSPIHVRRATAPTAEGLGETIEAIALAAVDGVACELGVSREELVLALRNEDAFDTFSEEHGLERDEVERAIHDGLVRAVDDAEESGALPGLVAPLVRRAAESVPPWLILEALEQLGSFLPG